MFFRCVAPKQKTLAIGVQWLFLRLLGTHKQSYHMNRKEIKTH